MNQRPKLFKIDPEMQRWCALLEQELSAWPEVIAKPMFGMIGFYHGESIFAAIPRTKAPVTARSLLIKLPGLSDMQLKPGQSNKRLKRGFSDMGLKQASGPGSGWVTFELESENDINEALLWLERAYEQHQRV